MKLLTGIAELTLETANISIEELTLTIEQLECKQTILEDLDTRIAPLISNETDREAEIIKAEDTGTKILTGLVHLRLKLNLCSCAAPTEPVPRIPDSALLSTATVPNTCSEPTTHSETAVSITSTTHTTVSSTAGRTPHTSVDLPLKTEVASRGLVYSVAGVTPTTEHTTVLTSASHATSQLPKLSIPTFTGDSLNWQLFWDCFDSAVNSNPTLSNVQKLSYVSQGSTAGGCLISSSWISTH